MSIARATAVMSMGTVLSRVTGVLRIGAFAYAFGAVESGRLSDTYQLANTAPNIIYELALGGVLTSVFVPVFVELLEKEGRERAWRVASAIINVTLVALTALTIILIIAAPLLAKLYSVHEEQEEATTFLLRLFLPQIVFYGLYFLTSGLLNAHRRFGAPMYTPVLNNLIVAAVFVFFRLRFGEVDLNSVTTSQLWIIGLGTTAGVVAFSVGLLPFARGLGPYRLTFAVRDPAVAKMTRLSVFVIGYVIANQIGYLVVQLLAKVEVGGYAAYTMAFTFFMLPHGLFAVSVITALLPRMSEYAVNQRWDDFRAQLSRGIRVTLLLVVPATIGYLVLARPIVELLLEQGVFSARSTDLVVGVLRMFVLGLVPFSIFQLLLRAFYALQDTKTPFSVNCVAVVVSIALNIVLFQLLGVKGLALGHAISYIFGSVMLAAALARRIGGIDAARVLRTAQRVVVAAATMGVVVWVVQDLLDAGAPQGNVFIEVARVLIPVIVGAAAYLGACVIARVEELGFLRNLVGGRAG